MRNPCKQTRPGHGEHGITGLETAIILIAFVVVAAVFAYTVLSAGLFASGKSTEAVYEGLRTTKETLHVQGNVAAVLGSIDTTGNRAGDTDSIVTLSFKLHSAMLAEWIDLTPAYVQHHTQNKLQQNSVTHTTVINFNTSEVAIPDCAWTAYFVGKNDGDTLLEKDETIAVTVWLVDYDYHPSVGNYYELGDDGDDPFLDDAANLLQPNETFCLQVISDKGAVLTIEKSLPANFDPLMKLDR